MLGETNQLRRVLELACAYEKGEWTRLSALAAELVHDPQDPPQTVESRIVCGDSVGHGQSIVGSRGVVGEKSCW